MQLILNTKTDIGIQRKMSAIEQESFDEKFSNKTLAEKVDDEIPNINEDCVKENVVEELNENEDFKTNDDTINDSENIPSECLNESSNNDCIENTNAIDLPEECCEQKQNDDKISNIIIEDEEPDNSDDVMVKQDEEKETDLKLSEEECNNVNGKNHEEEENVTSDVSENIAEELDKTLEETNEVLDDDVEVPSEKESDNNKEVKDDSVLNGEVISISDEKEEECITLTEHVVTGEEEKSNTSPNAESNNIATQHTDNESDDDHSSRDCISKDDIIDVPDATSGSSSVKPTTENNEVEQSKEIIEDAKDTNISSTKANEYEETENKNTNNNIKSTKKLPLICKLSNTLDILSDEEEEPVEKESQNKPSSPDEKQCINIEDDDDIMLIDEETNGKDEKQNPENADETKIDVKESGETPKTEVMDMETIENKETLNLNQDNANIAESDLNKTKEEEKPLESKPTQKPLLSVNFLKTCKKNLADMTRDELEEFCILKIVESVVDRSNLSEIKMQLKTLGQNIEEYKKKAMLLTKQNRDLQVVLKSVQEEQKKKSDVPITPLKITRSVGMQVFMTDKIAVRRKSALTSNAAQNNAICNNNTNRVKNQLNQSPKTPKTQTNANNTQQIPVPRLVPAVNNASNNKLQTPIAINSAKSPATTALPNGVRNSPPTPKPEKRPHSKMQQGNSVTVDLTDDEPPSKVLQRNVNPPVRLVSPQNLLAPQRQPFGTNISSPRKVYIPISGSQNQVRPGQTIMLKPIAPQGPRHRVPNILPKPSPNTNAVRMSRITRHPAPLPDSMKQYQPPNWKALPPAPELKLSKVENGIVISWKIDGYQEENQEEIASYQLYAYQETSSPPSTALWKKIGDVKALPLPMACTLTQFMAGYKYYFAVRAVDIRSRLGPFSAPGSILLLNKM
ncbi:activating transcription factor 7-interacting protein 1 [Vanessa cardui]|uniref:activating transcription factor 7-interacting protein 1 n=1 Tax=Vanessa cardui TaxID=171605 RepID=UPI001F138010|nr:activating transcription factor 7-interacting protein 1 [Vanessa cardui]XP_046968506.1 activating transcription factor 7-interacting protein 1 [Vanessa cardui]XP_046968507.1 activating transcription factor 7-interacting protein 1 [Vanessa cardui]XP_046968508.1 activating transcription factor 7-interacting protein 1 [Vanessa cardui]